MNWFKRHLNWTMGLSWIVCGILATIFASGGEVALTWNLFTGALILSIIAFIFIGLMFWATVWAIRQKGRSTAHALWLLVPFGFIVPLVLSNRNNQS